MLEAYDIEYELLEAYPQIAPQLGASIAMHATGLRILDQLGCLRAVESLASPSLDMHFRGPEKQFPALRGFGQGAKER
jgi:2-polyprenyl-6-methoxyphenol hydroxylase-like FAD-dependent oxidoreductase